MKRTILLIVSSLILSGLFARGALAHCEIPCGIYGDQTRVKLIHEHIGTIKKSMKRIKAIGQKKPLNHNQLVRWISNKEDHANKIQRIVSQYFMTQRIKVGAPKYGEKLGVLHKMLVYAMKCKQGVELKNAEALKTLTRKFEQLYF